MEFIILDTQSHFFQKDQMDFFDQGHNGQFSSCRDSLIIDVTQFEKLAHATNIISAKKKLDM